MPPWRGDLMVSMFDSRASAPGLSPGCLAGDIVLCSWARHFYFHGASLHPGVYSYFKKGCSCDPCCVMHVHVSYHTAH